jgi:hypothetical protein
LYGACVLGTVWGIGHTGALLLAALATAVFQLRIPPEIDQALEALVAILVAALGVNVLLRALGSVRVHRHEHTHGGWAHRHLHLHVGATMSHTHVHLTGEGTRPLLMGALHGLTGSAALLLLVLATMPSTLGAFLYVTVFGVGSTVGMLLVSGLVAIPFAVGGRSARVRVALQVAVGAASLGVGLAMLGALVGNACCFFSLSAR